MKEKKSRQLPRFFGRAAPLICANSRFLLVFLAAATSFAVGIASLTLIKVTSSTSFGESVEKVVPVPYWVSLVVIVASLSYMLQSKNVRMFKVPFLMTSVMLVISMRSVLAVISPYPSVPDTWGVIYVNESWRKFGVMSEQGLSFFTRGTVKAWPTSYMLAYLITSAGVPVYTFFRLAPTILFSLDLIFVYLLFKELVNEKTGMVAAFLFALLNSNSFFPLHYCPQMLGALLYIITMYIIFKAYKTRRPRHLALAFASIFAVVLTHHMTTLYLGISLVGAYLVAYFLRLQRKNGKNVVSSLATRESTFVKLSLPLAIFTFALWYFYGFIVYRVDAIWMLTEIARLLTTQQPRYGAGYYYTYLIQSPMSQLSILVFPAFILATAGLFIWSKKTKKENFEGWLWLVIGWTGALMAAFIFGNMIYGNYVDPSRSREIITLALYPVSASLLLMIFESESASRKALLTTALVALALFGVFCIYRGAQHIVYLSPPWWMSTFNPP